MLNIYQYKIKVHPLSPVLKKYVIMATNPYEKINIILFYI